MDTSVVILTWICLVMNCRGDDTDIRTIDRRLLLNDPNTLLSHIEALQREMALLKAQVTTLNTAVSSQRNEINVLQHKLGKINPEGTPKQCNFVFEIL